MRTTWLLLVTLLLRLTAAEQVELTLADGRVVRGVVVEVTADKLVIESRLPGRKGEMTVRQSVALAEIASRRTYVPPVADYPRLAAMVGDTAAAQLGLAGWCRDNGLGEQAALHGKRCLEIDPTNERASQLMATLGLYQHEGAWVTEADYLAKSGKVLYQDKVVTPEEAAAMKTADAAVTEERKANQAANAVAAEVKRLERQLKTIDTQLAELEKQHATATAALAATKGATEAHDAAKKELTAAKDAADEERRTKTTLSAATQKRTNDATAKLAKAKRAANTAEGEATTAAATLKRLETRRATLQTQRTQAQADLAKAKPATAEATPAVAPKP